jgi:hypothetical protein
MNAGEISLLPKPHRESQFQESVVLAVRRSICDGNSEPANRLLQLLPFITRKPGAKDALIEYFQTWGKLYFDTSAGVLKYAKKHNSRVWSDEYEIEVRASRWTDLIGASARQTKPILDADKEFRKVLDRLRRASEDPTKTIFHASLLAKVQEVLYAYGRTDEWTREENRSRTLFDQSVRMSTTRATKFAKGT